jgi:hypothetical protein
MQLRKSPTEAAALYAEANPSDPFAYRRMRTHLERGLDDATKVFEDALRTVNVRTMTKRGMRSMKLPKPLRKRAKKEVKIFGTLFTDTAAEIAEAGIDVAAYEQRLLGRLSLD